MKRMMMWVIATGFVVMSVDIGRTQSGRSPFGLHEQSEEQQARDHWECHKQAVEQTGYDPSALHGEDTPLGRAASEGAAIGGQALKGAASGAAVGAAVGAVTGKAGRRAAIGAAGGGVHGVLRGLGAAGERRQRPQSQPQHQRWREYQRALATCMDARGSSVK